MGSARVFEELSAMAVGELSQVFARMCEADVRPLLEAIEAAPRIFTVGAGREGLATKSFAMRLATWARRATGSGTTPRRPSAPAIC
jgi:D-arabinose 5-phosphate isomerase GutQ